MWRNLFISSVICIVSLAANADVVVTLNGDNMTDVIVMANYPGQLIVAVDGNTPVGPNDISIEAQNGTLEAGEPNGGYYFQFVSEGEAAVNLITNVEMIIDGNSIPADTLIYQLWLCYNPDANIYAAFGIGLAEIFPPPEGEGEMGGEDYIESADESIVLDAAGEPTEQFGTSTEEMTLTEETVDYSGGSTGYDPYWDLNADNRIDFADFAILATGWQTTYNIFDLSALCAAFASADCCADMNVPDISVWQYVDFTGIEGCERTDCWFGEMESDPCNDNCGNRAVVRCEETEELGGYCAYNYWFNYRRVGLCIYKCGINAFQVQKNRGGCRNVVVRHRTQDQLTPGCDAGTSGKYDWQVYAYSAITGNGFGFCRESSLDPGPNEYWEPTQGQTSQCENQWW